MRLPLLLKLTMDMTVGPGFTNSSFQPVAVSAVTTWVDSGNGTVVPASVLSVSA
jgi:hypothetical protein